jgi:DNA-binding NarL/FixJ family response regulator
MLTDKTILIVENEVLIALDIQRILAEHNAGEVVFARTSQEIAGQDAFLSAVGLAIIELRHQDPAGVELARGLIAAGIACVMMSADVQLRKGVPQLPKARVLLKPFSEEELVEAIRSALHGGAALR